MGDELQADTFWILPMEWPPMAMNSPTASLVRRYQAGRGNLIVWTDRLISAPASKFLFGNQFQARLPRDTELNAPFDTCLRPGVNAKDAESAKNDREGKQHHHGNGEELCGKASRAIVIKD